MSAAKAGLTAFRRAYDNPGATPTATALGAAQSRYEYLWSHYDSSVFEDLQRWQAYKSHFGLYRQTRTIYSPVRRLVDLYAGTIYPGVLSEDGAHLPDGVPLAVPLADDTDDGLRRAIAQLWQWSNWQAGKAVFVRYGAALGNVLVEVEDAPERGKVCLNVVWPGLVDPSSLILDRAGNLKAYALEYRVQDGADSFTYRKEVTSETFRTFKDGEPFDYSGEAAQGAEWANPYGFVPAVWVKHTDIGGDFGAPAIDGSLGKIDELNSLASHVHDQVHKKISAPALLPGVTSLKNLNEREKRPAATAEEYATGTVLADREDLLLIGAPAGADVKSLAGTLELGDAVPYLEKLIAEIEQDHPELTLYRELRGMSQVTGPGAQRLLGDAAARVLEAQANYDRASIALFGMAVAIGGWRAQTGAWGRGLTRQQEKFRDFDLTSYAKGELDLAIMPRPLVAPTKAEQWAEELSRANAIKALVEAGLSVEMAVAAVDGKRLDDPEIAAFTKTRLESIQREQALALEDVPEPVAQ